MSELKTTAGKKRKKSLEERLYTALSQEWGGNEDVPLAHLGYRWTDRHGVERVFVFANDAFEVGFGYPNEWQLFLRREDFHKVMRWYLKKWAFDEWFGLRRIIWYKLLHRRVNRYKR